jgi:hypothetical protein
MKTWSVSYQDWLILGMQLDGGWAIKCLPPRRHSIATDWQAHKTLETAVVSAKQYIDRAIALYVLADALLELCEAGKIQDTECHRLLVSLGYC